MGTRGPRRLAVLVVALLSAAPLPARGKDVTPRPCLGSVGGVDLETTTIPDLTRAMKSGRVTSARLVDAYLARIRAYDQAGDPPPNSIRMVNPNARREASALDAERRRGHVRGALHGIPVLLKDNIGTRDLPTTAGSIALANNVPRRDAHVTALLRRAGAVILGKTNLAEFANWVSLTMPNGYSSLGGQVSSAYDGSNPSGSSSGSAVAMSLSLAAATVGTETAGSIVSPASYAGLIGVKPTVGVVSRAGVIPLAASWDTPGPITRSAVDAALVLQAIAGRDRRDQATSAGRPPDFLRYLGPNALRGARIGYDPVMLKIGYDPPGTGPVFARALRDLEQLGATLVAAPTVRAAEVTSQLELAAIPNEFKAGINRYLVTEGGPQNLVHSLSDIIDYNNRHPDRVPYGQDLLIASDATPGSAELGQANAAPIIGTTAAALDATFDANDLDAIVGPGDYYSYHAAASRWASLVVPAGMNGGVPEGLFFMARPFSEPRLLGFASAFERRGRTRVPPPTAVNRALVAAACR